jgi:acyl carrier protein
MELHNLKAEIKELLVRELNLEGRDPTTIDDDAPLFGSGLALDSLDALQLAMSIEERYGVRVPEGDDARAIFASVSALARHVAATAASLAAASVGSPRGIPPSPGQLR